MPFRSLVKPGSRLRLADIDPAETSGYTKARAQKICALNAPVIADLAYRLYAQNKHSILIVLQGMDTAGKDGVIRHVLATINPQSCVVTPFKKPTPAELAHDFLWRVHPHCPPPGQVAVFNRSHYEDVVAVRVLKLVPRAVWEKRYELINAFESLLQGAGTTILKLFLHISRDEQKKRLEDRLRNPQKRWKFAPGDIEQRRFWDEYQRAYQDALSRCSTPHAPWHVVPADRNWHRNLLASQLVRQTLERLNPQFPQPRIAADVTVPD